MYTNNNNKKKEVLVVFGISATTVNKNNEDGTPNRWYISSAEEIKNKIQEKIDTGIFDKIVLVQSDSSIFNFKETSKLKIKVFGDNIFSKENEISFLTHNDETQIMNGDYFDFLLPPESYNLTVSGVDLVGVLSDSVKTFGNYNYHVSLSPNLVKSYKDITYNKIRGYCKIIK